MSAVKNAEGTQKLSVFKMTWPIFIEILLQMMVGNVDQFMLSHYSQHSVAAVGNANQIINIVILALSVISMAAGQPRKSCRSLHRCPACQYGFRRYHQRGAVYF